MCTQAQAQGTACTQVGAYCSHDDGTWCQCTNCPPSGLPCTPNSPTVWYCQTPPTTQGCPPAQPNLGTACDKESVICSYQCGNPQRICSSGAWAAGSPTPCPVSTRNAKKEIRYLSSEEIRATAEQALRLRLATYEYKAAPLSGRRHLGFIIEDDPSSPAVDRDHDMVDLYGYASMLVATTQQQQRQIESLEARIQALQDRLAKMERRRSRSSGR
jgi:hypothetical protein